MPWWRKSGRATAVRSGHDCGATSQRKRPDLLFERDPLRPIRYRAGRLASLQLSVAAKWRADSGRDKFLLPLLSGHARRQRETVLGLDYEWLRLSYEPGRYANRDTRFGHESAGAD